MPTAAMADARRHRSLFALIPAIHQRTVANHGMIQCYLMVLPMISDGTPVIVGADRGLAAVMERVKQVAAADAPVLILGETGAGKEVVARAIHTASRRARGPFHRVNCGAIPSELIDSELFGHEKGAFTGATERRHGWFERADGGSLLLDEVGELPLAAQVRLLRVLQDGRFERVGGQRHGTVDVRIIAATHRDLPTMVADKTFREDLWYRLAVFPIRLPTLRERREDIPALARHLAAKACGRYGTPTLAPSEADVALLSAYDWPGERPRDGRRHGTAPSSSATAGASRSPRRSASWRRSPLPDRGGRS